MSEFGGFLKHKKTQHALKSGRITSLLIVKASESKLAEKGPFLLEKLKLKRTCTAKVKVAFCHLKMEINYY